MRVNVDLILLSFLKEGQIPDNEYNYALNMLEQEVNKRSSDGELQTDGHSPVPRLEGPSVTEVDEELCRRIAAQLAELGDKFDREGRIKKEMVESVVEGLLSDSLSEKRFQEVINSALPNLPPGIEKETAILAVTMTLTKKVGCNVPNLLQNFFRYTADFIQSNYVAYLQQLSRQR
ncbi:BH3-interacting domain death agonist-like [Spea bombifrons]|uniref:BH3-interacting domain death agonist-like n=1 Tax=Spea bombifrons TaxID=233779 RepID=UPI00234AB4F0|nr:BH3-interacting domain death agonist-like [Spea bombifrons]